MKSAGSAAYRPTGWLSGDFYYWLYYLCMALDFIPSTRIVRPNDFRFMYTASVVVHFKQ